MSYFLHFSYVGNSYRSSLLRITLRFKLVVFIKYNTNPKLTSSLFFQQDTSASSEKLYKLHITRYSLIMID